MHFYFKFIEKRTWYKVYLEREISIFETRGLSLSAKYELVAN